jgi:hypothetical protein
MKIFTVPVAFELSTTDKARAELLITNMLHQLNDYDQLPDWEVGVASDKTPAFYQAPGT